MLYEDLLSHYEEWNSSKVLYLFIYKQKSSLKGKYSILAIFSKTDFSIITYRITFNDLFYVLSKLKRNNLCVNLLVLLYYIYY